MVLWFSWWFSSHGIESLKITFDKNKIQVLENNFFPQPPMGRRKDSENVPPLMPRSELLGNPRQTQGNWPLFPNLFDFYANFTKINIPLFVPWILRVGKNSMDRIRVAMLAANSSAFHAGKAKSLAAWKAISSWGFHNRKGTFGHVRSEEKHRFGRIMKKAAWRIIPNAMVSTSPNWV